MPELTWQKSSYSGGPEGNCLYMATAPDGTLRLRESAEPGVVLAADRRGLAALLRHIDVRAAIRRGGQK